MLSKFIDLKVSKDDYFIPDEEKKEKFFTKILTVDNPEVVRIP